MTLQPIELPTFMIDLKEAAGPYRAGPHRIEIGNNPETLRTFKKWLRLFVSNDVPHIPPSMT